jgi:hypothetical protein
VNWPIPLLRLSDLAFKNDSLDSAQLCPFGYVGLRWHLNGAEALSTICNELSVQYGRPAHVWLPAYFCGQSLRYLRALPLELNFYPVTSGLLPDYESLGRLCSGKQVDLLVHVHYFGRVSGQQKSRDFADKVGALLIEDCAHVISPLIKDRWMGDYLIFSPHKLFALPLLGLAIGRSSFTSGTSVLKGLPWSWILRQFVRRIKWKSIDTPWGKVWSDLVSFTEKRSLHGWTIRAATERLVRCQTVIKDRHRNVSILLGNLQEYSGWSPINICNDDEAPYLLGMLCDTAILAQKRFEIFNRRVRLVMQWPDLPVELQEYPDMIGFCEDRVDRTLLFFVHQQLDSNTWMTEVKKAMQTDGFNP